jgi:hypothetical protein
MIEAVDCTDREQMYVLAAEMRKSAEKNVDEVEYEGSTTEQEAMSKAAMSGEQLLRSGKLRLMVVDGRPITVVCTLQKDQKKNLIWNLSVSHPEMPPGRVEDDLAFEIAKVFLGDGYSEEEAKAFWKTIRHFVKKKPRTVFLVDGPADPFVANRGA